MAIHVLPWMPFLLSFSVVYFVLGGHGLAPRLNCQFESGKAITLLNIDVEVGLADCPLGLVAETYTQIRVSQRGDWFPTELFESVDGNPVDFDIEAVDAHTIRIIAPTLSEISVRNVHFETPEWRGVKFVYEWRASVARSK